MYSTALLQGYHPDYVDRSLRLTSYWADCELLVADDIKAARAVWEDALKSPAGRYSLCSRVRDDVAQHGQYINITIWHDAYGGS